MKNLRELSKEYAQNIIDQDTYRKVRNELIKGICAGEIEVAEHEYLTPLEASVEDVDDTTQNMTTQILNSAKSKSLESEKSKKLSTKKTKKNNVLIATGVLIVLSVISLVILLSPSTKENLSDGSSDQIITSSTAQNLIIDFIQQKNWAQENLNKFVTAWQQLSDEERSAASTSPEIQRLTNIIYRQLQDERALLSLGDVENSVANQRFLVNFADRLGIYDTRLTVFEPEPDTGADIEIETIQATIDPEKIIAGTDKKNDLLPVDLEPEFTNAEIPQEIIETTNDQIKTTTTTIAEAESSVKKITAEQLPTKTTTQKTITRAPTNKAACKISLVKSRKPFCRDKIEGVGNGPTMVVIRGGNFTMGGKNKTEQPAHTVTIHSPFAMSSHEISFGEFSQFCKSTGTSCPKQPWSGKDYPAVNVTHGDAIAYVKWLSEKTGQLYRLPSEAEWEYAARAGTKTEYPFGDEVLITDAVFSDKKKLSAPLPKSDRSINRNKFRLYHVVGNVREWVADTWHEGYSGAPENGSARIDKGVNQFVVRGGSYSDTAKALRSGARVKFSSADNFTGFRVLQELSE